MSVHADRHDEPTLPDTVPEERAVRYGSEPRGRSAHPGRPGAPASVAGVGAHDRELGRCVQG